MLEPTLQPETAEKLRLWREKNKKTKKRERVSVPKTMTPKQCEDWKEHQAALARLGATGE